MAKKKTADELAFEAEVAAMAANAPAPPPRGEHSTLSREKKVPSAEPETEKGEAE